MRGCKDRSLGIWVRAPTSSCSAERHLVEEHYGTNFRHAKGAVSGSRWPVRRVWKVELLGWWMDRGSEWKGSCKRPGEGDCDTFKEQQQSHRKSCMKEEEGYSILLKGWSLSNNLGEPVQRKRQEEQRAATRVRCSLGVRRGAAV